MKKRHIVMYKLLTPVGKLVLKIKLNFKPQRADKIDGPFIVISNHTTNFDPIAVGAQFKTPMSFVASDHIFRKKIIAFALNTAFDVIPRRKGKEGISTVKEMLTRVKNGDNICIFPEGNTCFSGETDEIIPTISKFVKKAGITLITYKHIGGYLSAPRWGYTPRRSQTHGKIMRVVSPEELKNLSAEEINEIIKADIYENAYETQRSNPVIHKGKRLAEGIENVLYICPKCKRLNTLKSKGDEFFCDCGLHGKYDELGFIGGDGFSFSSILEWDKWQNEYVRSVISENPDKTLCYDEGVTLYKINDDHSSEKIASGNISTDAKSIFISDKEYPFSSIRELVICGKSTVTFTDEKGDYYEAKRKTPYGGYKYMKIYQAAKGDITNG